MSDERAVEAIQLCQPVQSDLSQVSPGYFEPHQLGELSKLGRLYVLADGVSGVASGNIVSQYAVGKVLHSYFTSDTAEPKDRLLEAIKQANADIYERNQEYPERRVMGTTLVAALIHNDKLVVANVGDSKVYVVWDQDIELLNQVGAITDETKEVLGPLAAQPLIPAKVEPPDQSPAKTSEPVSPRQKFPPGLGLGEEIRIDTYSRRLFAGDAVVLCSGGLTGYVSDKEIAKAVSEHSHAEAIRRLMALATERGNRDHLAISVARVLSSPVTQRPPAFRPLPLAPKWSDFETPPQPGSKTPTKPSSTPIVSPMATKPDPAAEARLRLNQPKFQPLQPPIVSRWQGCAILAVAALLIFAIFVVAWQFLIPPDLIAAVPFLGEAETPSAGDQNTAPEGEAGAEDAGQTEAGQPPASTGSSAEAPDSTAAEVTLVAENKSPVPEPAGAFNSPLATPVAGAANQGDAITLPTPVAGTPTPTPVPLPTIVVPNDCTNKARFRRDVTVPDGTEFGPGEKFEKVWRVQNAGTCPWGPGYTARHIGGDTLGVQADTLLVDEVSPDADGEITVAMTAPSVPGSYRGDWQLHDLSGEPFGPEMYLEIEVLPANPANLDESDLLTLYDFIDRAAEATWSSGSLAYDLLETDISETMQLPGAEGIVAVGPARLRGNINSDGNVLLTYPHRELGVIEGKYVVDTPLQPTDALAANIGFIKLSVLPDDGVTFEVRFTPTGGTEQVVMSKTVQYRDSPVSLLQPLAEIEPGQTGTFTLRVVGGDRLSQDWATWIQLSLIRQ